jgi:FlaA1/EpsC-like NDP-sugar epimerase
MLSEYAQTLKLFCAAGGLGSGAAILAQEVIGDVPVLQYGAIGVLGVCAIYVTTKLVPMAIQGRQKETTAFITTLTEEREKLVASMEKLTNTHVKEMAMARAETEALLRDLNIATLTERKVWAAMMKESNQIHSQNTVLLTEVSTTLKDIKNNTHAS